jgi:glycosyltransferase involved in cell wall biosynthesis
MSKDSIVSIIIPTYYRNELLKTTLDHVAEQTYKPIEVIVVDDSGEKHAKPVVDEFRPVKYIGFDKNKGPNIARTEGIQASRGKYIQLLDDDDFIFRNKIEKQISVFQKNPELVVVYSGGVYEGGEPFTPSDDGRGDVLEQALTFNLPACITSSMLIRREPLTEIFPLPNPPGSDDTYLKIELAQRGQFDFVSEPLLLKGDDPDARSYSKGAVEGTREIVSVYGYLYDRFPSNVRKTAKAAADYRTGKYYLRKNFWSPSAIRYILQAIYTEPGINMKYIGMLFFSVFGKLGYITQKYGKRVYRRSMR